jgi:hypothetical protein
MAKARDIRVWTRLSASLRQRVSGYCAASGIAERTVFEAALGQYIDGTRDLALLMRRLDRLGRAVERVHRDLDVLSVAFGTFVRLWIAHTPAVSAEAVATTRATAEDRYQTFLELVAEQFDGGQRLIDQLPREALANETELEELLADSARSSLEREG